MHPITRAHDVAAAVGLNLHEAIAAYEIYAPIATDKTLLEYVNRSGFSQSFILIRSSILRTVLLSLCRIWDQGKSPYSLKNLFKLLEHPQVIEHYEKAGSFDRTSFLSLQERYRSVLESDEQRGIKFVRGQWLAHTGPRPEKRFESAAVSVNYGDERRLIEMTAPIVFEAAALVQCALIPASNVRKMWRPQADEFWRRLLGT